MAVFAHTGGGKKGRKRPNAPPSSSFPERPKLGKKGNEGGKGTRKKSKSQVLAGRRKKEGKKEELECRVGPNPFPLLSILECRRKVYFLQPLWRISRHLEQISGPFLGVLSQDGFPSLWWSFPGLFLGRDKALSWPLSWISGPFLDGVKDISAAM